MAQLVIRVETDIFLDHGTFELLDDGGPQEIGPGPEWLSTGANAVNVRVGSWEHEYATVVVEAWDGAPPATSGWSREKTATVRLDSGTVEINPLVEGEDTRWLEVGAPGEYQVRGYADVTVERERYLFQFWRHPVG